MGEAICYERLERVEVMSAMSGLTDEQRDKVLAEMVLGVAHAICATTHGGKGYCVNCRSIAERVYAPMIADGHLLPTVERMIRDAKAEAWDECATEAFGRGLLHDADLEEMVARNPYRHEDGGEGK